MAPQSVRDYWRGCPCPDSADRTPVSVSVASASIPDTSQILPYNSNWFLSSDDEDFESIPEQVLDLYHSHGMIPHRHDFIEVQVEDYFDDEFSE
ncbi:hypothetical protein RCL1_000465 [Eukaryota sp. TZLM3-RCL]